jgi:hypothetical protein
MNADADAVLAKKCPLTVGPGAPVIELVQQSGDDLCVATVGEDGAGMIEQTGAERPRSGSLPGERVHAGPGESMLRTCQVRGHLPGPAVCRWRPAAGLGQGGRDEGAGQPGHQHRGADIKADVGDPDLDRGVARGQPGRGSRRRVPGPF